MTKRLYYPKLDPILSVVQSATRPVCVAQPRRSLVSEKVRTPMPFDTHTHIGCEHYPRFGSLITHCIWSGRTPQQATTSSVNEKLILDMGDDAASMGKLIENPLHNHCLIDNDCLLRNVDDILLSRGYSLSSQINQS